VEAARLLRNAEEHRGGDLGQRSSRQGQLRPYCRAYLFQELRQFPGWQQGVRKEPTSAGFEPLTDSSTLFLHRDFTVTRSLWAGEQVVFSIVCGEWKTFCENVLHFHPPSDFECLPVETVNA
jgi:hypothetical protein